MQVDSSHFVHFSTNSCFCNLRPLNKVKTLEVLRSSFLVRFQGRVSSDNFIDGAGDISHGRRWNTLSKHKTSQHQSVGIHLLILTIFAFSGSRPKWSLSANIARVGLSFAARSPFSPIKLISRLNTGSFVWGCTIWMFPYSTCLYFTSLTS